jgi:nucleotide-binding universal stress UspA family protein
MNSFPRKILLATDGSKDAQLALRMAAELASGTNSEVHVVYVRPKTPPGYPGYYVGPEIVEHPEREQEELDKEAQRLLNAQVEKIRATGGSTAQTHLKVGRADAEIVALSEEIGAGLIVVGSRGQGGMRRALMGSVSDSVLRHAHCPVLVARAEQEKDEEGVGIFPTKILLAVDGSKEAALAANTAAEIASISGSELHVVHVGESPLHLLDGYDPFSYSYMDAETIQTIVQEAESEARKTLDEQVRHIEGAGATVTRSYLRQGRPDKEIVDLAERIGAGLIVMGSRGLGRMKRALMGSVSKSVVCHIHCPVLVVRKEESEEAAGPHAEAELI